LERFLGIKSGNESHEEGAPPVVVVETPIEERNGEWCLFLRRTYYGVRCVLMSPEDWRRLRNNGKHLPCWRGGNGCNLKARILNCKGGIRVAEGW